MTPSFPPAETMSLQAIKAHLSLAMAQSEDAVKIGNVYGSEVTALARHLKGTKKRHDLEAAAREMAAELFPRLNRGGQTFDSDPTYKIKHLVTGLVTAKYSLSNVLTPDMAWRMSEGYGVTFLAQAFSTSNEHLQRAVSPDKLSAWASFAIQNEASFARQCAAIRASDSSARGPLSLPPMELAQTYNMVNGALAQTLLNGVYAGAHAHMDTFSKIGGADDLEALKQCAVNAGNVALAKTLSAVIASYNHAEQTPEHTL